jgi:hypothetical protein
MLSTCILESVCSVSAHCEAFSDYASSYEIYVLYTSISSYAIVACMQRAQ